MTNFHTRLKQLRKANELTQEHLAEYMGVSPQAISRWETGATYPDIAQIPLLSHIFQVSADHLLGIDIVRADEAIATIHKQAQECAWMGDFHGACDCLRAGLERYPCNYSLMVALAENISCIGKDGSNEEIVTLCETVIAACSDTEQRNKALQILIFRLKNIGQHENAMHYVKLLSPTEYSVEDTTIAVLERHTPSADLKSYITFLADRLMMCLAMLSHKSEYTTEDKIALLQGVVDICQAVYPNGDANYYAYYAVSALSELAKIYAALQDEKNTLKTLEELSDYATLFDTYDNDAKCTSPAVRNIEHGRPISMGETMCEQIRTILSDDAYDFVRNSKRFVEIESIIFQTPS